MSDKLTIHLIIIDAGELFEKESKNKIKKRSKQKTIPSYYSSCCHFILFF